MNVNLDTRTVEGFGDEWSRFDQAKLDTAELERLFESYFRIFPWEKLPEHAVGFDLGCGSGRWALKVAQRVGKLHCIDASEKAVVVAKGNLSGFTNVEFIHASVDSIPLADDSMDFGYSLGVLHHVPNTAAGIRSCVAKLKPGSPFLIYLYYAFDNRAAWFRSVWKISDFFRRGVSSMPFWLKKIVTDAIAVTVYFPLGRSAQVASRIGLKTDSFPLAAYKYQSFYTMRTDSLDRFGTRIEQRFTRDEIKEMMEAGGLKGVIFSEDLPYWCAVGLKALDSSS